MTDAPDTWYVRLRRRAGDPRLYLTSTSSGTTEAGYLAGASIDIPGPILHLELEEDLTSHLYGDGTDAWFYESPVSRILLADVQDLAKTVKPAEHHFHALLRVLDKFREDLSTDDPPPCGHEDVIDTTELGQADPHGLCFWCTTPLVQRDGEWVPG